MVEETWLRNYHTKTCIFHHFVNLNLFEFWFCQRSNELCWTSLQGRYIQCPVIWYLFPIHCALLSWTLSGKSSSTPSTVTSKCQPLIFHWGRNILYFLYRLQTLVNGLRAKDWVSIESALPFNARTSTSSAALHHLLKTQNGVKAFALQIAVSATFLEEAGKIQFVKELLLLGADPNIEYVYFQSL